jgi:hypothetical protein
MADAGINGRISDGGVLGNTAFGKALVDKLLQIPEPGTLPKSEKKLTVAFVGDDACVLTENFMKPSGHAGQVARMGEERGVYRVLVGILRERDHWGDLGVDGWVILGWICRRWDVGIWTGLGWPRIEPGGGRL